MEIKYTEDSSKTNVWSLLAIDTANVASIKTKIEAQKMGVKMFKYNAAEGEFIEAKNDTPVEANSKWYFEWKNDGKSKIQSICFTKSFKHSDGTHIYVI